MVNPKTSSNNEEAKSNLEDAIIERRKTAAHCLNLECRNEQLKILIEKLNKLADHRADLISKTSSSKTFSQETNHPYLESVSVVEELKEAKENSKFIEKCISELKDKIIKLDRILSR